jgi:hypothetical protein
MESSFKIICWNSYRIFFLSSQVVIFYFSIMEYGLNFTDYLTEVIFVLIRVIDHIISSFLLSYCVATDI